MDTEATTVYPDIVVHRRGDDHDNRIIIEVNYQHAFFVLLNMTDQSSTIEVP